MARDGTSWHVIEREGIPIHYWLSGPKDRPLVVLTHAVATDHSLYDRQVEVLSKNYRVLVWDVRGHGRSRPMSGDFSIRSCAEDLMAIIDEIGVDKAMYVGLSMGGLITQELAFKWPQRVRAMALVGTVCLTWKQPLLVKLMKLVSTPTFRLFPKALLWWFGGVCAGIKPETQKHARELRQHITKSEFIKFWKGITRCDHYEADYHIKCPFLLTHGQHDSMVGLGVIKRTAPFWASREPSCRYVVIPDAGHNVCMDNPKYFNRILCDFLAEC
jgi:pimeloyl-ACP methyl ester carboxylesterase